MNYSSLLSLKTYHVLFFLFTFSIYVRQSLQTHFNSRAACQEYLRAHESFAFTKLMSLSYTKIIDPENTITNPYAQGLNLRETYHSDTFL